MHQRYGIFYTAPPGPLADFGAAWLGWDSAAGRAVAHPDVTGVDVAAITSAPRKYGFHATLKAPFRLAEGATVEGLQAALIDVAQRYSPVSLNPLDLRFDHNFLALRSAGDQTALRNLAGSIVRDLDAFRAPLNDHDIARRRKTPLTPHQDQQMLTWGYPYVFADFNFHMTLSGALDGSVAASVQQQLARLAADALPADLTLDALTLVGEDDAGMFHQLYRVPLSGEGSDA